MSTQTANTPVLPATLRLGPVHITVTDLDRSTAFYQHAIGLQLHERDGALARMGAGGEDLLVLHENRAAKRAGRHAGLYHFALLHPSRHELARAVLRLMATRTPVSGASDHQISEAIYLPDPDGNGIELAADRSDETWGDLSDFERLGPAPLDMAGLVELVANEEPRAEADPGLKVGHLHLHVGDVEQALGFYRDLLGFEVQTRMDSAAFVSAGGYHHHLGLNVWRGLGVPPAPADAVGLREWTVVLESADQVGEVRARLGDAAQTDGRGFVVLDPWNNAVRFTHETGD